MDTVNKNFEDDFPAAKEKSFCMTYIWHWLTFFLLSAIAVSIGVVIIIILQHIQLNQFENIYTSSCTQNINSLQDHFNNHDVTTRIVTQVYNGALQDPSFTGTSPNVTLANYENIMVEMKLMAGFDYISFSPLVTNETRRGFEAFAIQHVGSLNGPSLLHNQVSRGILNTSFFPAGDYVFGSKYPTWFFPIWQIAAINSSSHLVLVDPKWSYAAAMDSCIVTEQSSYSDIKTSPQVVNGLPFSVLFSPMFDLQGQLYGIVSAAFSWVRILYFMLFL